MRLGTAQGFDVAVDSIDTCRPNGDGDCGDILDAKLMEWLTERCSKGVYVIVHAGVPCNTWSAARFLNCDKPGYPKPMRTRTLPFGGDPSYPMTKAQAAKCDRHSEIFRRTVILLKCASEAGAVVGLENPEEPGEDAKPSILYTDECKDLADASGSKSVKFDQCRFCLD